MLNFIQIYELENTLQSAQQAVSLRSRSSNTRIFTLGVGDDVSTALIEGLARVGNGIHRLTTTNEELTSKCMELLNAGRIPPTGTIGDLRVDWGFAPTSQMISSTSRDTHYNAFAEPTQSQQSLPTIQQAPSKIPNLYPSNRFLVSAIVNTTEAPKIAKLIGTTSDGLPPPWPCFHHK